MMREIMLIAEKNQKRAFEIIENIGIIPLWESVGATINLVGSLKTGLLVKHLDIDFHVYTNELNISQSFSVIEKLAQNPAILRIEYANGINTVEECIEWHAWYKDTDERVWQFDMIHIRKGSRYDGYFENVAAKINERITQEERDAVLLLKYETPDDEKIMGIEYYNAVMDYGVRNYRDFIFWRKEFSKPGVLEWIP